MLFRYRGNNLFIIDFRGHFIILLLFRFILFEFHHSRSYTRCFWFIFFYLWRNVKAYLFFWLIWRRNLCLLMPTLSIFLNDKRLNFLFIFLFILSILKFIILLSLLLFNLFLFLIFPNSLFSAFLFLFFFFLFKQIRFFQYDLFFFFDRLGVNQHFFNIFDRLILFWAFWVI